MKNEKQEFLYNYGRAAFDDELQRFRNIEDKAAKYLSLLSVGVVAYSVVLRFYSEEFFPPETLFQWVICIAVSITYVALFSSWSFLYRALRFTEMPRLPFDQMFLDEYEPESLPTIHFVLAKTCAEALKYAMKGNSVKSTLLIKGYKDIAFAMWSLTLSVILIMSYSSTINKEKIMRENEVKEKSKQEKTSTEPNRDVLQPKVRFVLDHAIPEIKQGRQQINESKDGDSKK
ncbi:MAG: hypothetical protein GYB38_08500 [Gammaproteobacteria bacterium]|nr:hypothetical protein [Gammaproteobacteria bacterium]